MSCASTGNNRIQTKEQQAQLEACKPESLHHNQHQVRIVLLSYVSCVDTHTHIYIYMDKVEQNVPN